MITIMKWGLVFVVAFLAFTFNALNPSYFDSSPATPNVTSVHDGGAQPPSAPAKKGVLMTLRANEDTQLTLADLPLWERYMVGVRMLVDDGVNYLGKRMEVRFERGSDRARGYATLICFFALIGVLGLLVGHRRNVNRPHDGPSFSFSMMAGKLGLIAAAFFASSWLRDLAVANIGEASILAILFLSITFAGFTGATAFSRAT
ncbi:MAG: hypothetical protein ACPGN3_08220 [Opitutales bacterium]